MSTPSNIITSLFHSSFTLLTSTSVSMSATEDVITPTEFTQETIEDQVELEEPAIRLDSYFSQSTTAEQYDYSSDPLSCRERPELWEASDNGNPKSNRVLLQGCHFYDHDHIL